MYATDANKAEQASMPPSSPRTFPALNPLAPEFINLVSLCSRFSSNAAERNSIQSTETGSTEYSSTSPYYNEDLERFPQGLPRFAAERNYRHNGSSFRFFGYLHHLSIDYIMGRIAFLNEEMMKFENFDKYHMQNLTPYQKRLPGEAAVPEKWDALMELVIKELGIYAPMLLRLRELQALPRVDYDEHTGLIQDIMGSDRKTSDKTPMLGKELCSLYDWPDDFVSTRKERVHTAFAGLLRQHWFKRLICKLSSPHGHGYNISSKRIRTFLNLTSVLTKVSILLTPGGILYLIDMTAGQAFTVLALFALLATGILPTIVKSPYLVFIGAIAYVAGLAVFLPNVRSGPQ